MKEKCSCINITFFGKFSYSVNDEELIFKNKKAKELLSLLIAHQGKRVNKSFIAESLWPETAYSCRDNLYKAHSYLKKMNLPIKTARNEMWFEITEDMQIDFMLFDQLYKNKADIDICRQIIEIHRYPFLCEENYEWTTSYSSHFEIKYFEVIEILIKHYSEEKNKKMVTHYEKLLEF